MKKNDEIKLAISGQGHTGEGIGKVEGYPLFVEFALPGEEIHAKVLKTNKSYGFAKMVEVEKASSHRVEPPCPYYYRCGGCHLMHSDYEGQLDFKKTRVKDSLERIGKIKVKEPFASLVTQGMVTHETYKSHDGRWLSPLEVEAREGAIVELETGEPIVRGRVEKMSKSKNNGVDPQSQIEKFGADATRLFILFAAPPEKDLNWNDQAAEGSYRFLTRLWRVAQTALPDIQAGLDKLESYLKS